MAASGLAVVRALDRRRVQFRWLAIPSWMVSLAFHAALLVTFVVFFHRPARVGDPRSNNFETGIYFDPNGSGEFDSPGKGKGKGPPGEAGDGSPGDQSDDSSAATGDATTGDPSRDELKELRLDEQPPVALDLPTRSVASVGAVSALSSGGAPFGDARQMIRSTGTATGGGGGGGTGTGRGNGGTGAGGGTGGGGGGGTSFFGHKARGNKFVFLIDISGSMHDYNAISKAKSELLASLEQLDADQQFQVIFYNQKCFPMEFSQRGERKALYFTGTDTNRTLASQFIRSVQPDGGTMHFGALMTALSYSPEVLFLLTDAGEPALSAKELDQIKRRNGGHTQIHSIELGKFADLSLENNFLKKLARENGGAHVYRDVTKFSQE